MPATLRFNDDRSIATIAVELSWQWQDVLERVQQVLTMLDRHVYIIIDLSNSSILPRESLRYLRVFARLPLSNRHTIIFVANDRVMNPLRALIDIAHRLYTSRYSTLFLADSMAAAHALINKQKNVKDDDDTK